MVVFSSLQQEKRVPERQSCSKMRLFPQSQNLQVLKDSNKVTGLRAQLFKANDSLKLTLSDTQIC